jgi:acetyl-CoA acyltransferase
MIAAGTESMSMIPLMGRLTPNLDVFARDENLGIAYGMGLTAERVAERWKVSREDQDAFALASHTKALAAQAAGEFAGEISPYPVRENVPDLASGKIVSKNRNLDRDEGPRADTSEGREAAAGVRGRAGDRRQQLADVGRRGRGDRVSEKILKSSR